MTDTMIMRAERIARLNDHVRHGLDRSARRVITRGCLSEFCPEDGPDSLITQAELMRAVRHHSFTDDAYGERDFGRLTFRDQHVLFKIDCYDLALEYGSEDPTDASKTTRVLTIMLAEEY